MEEQFNLENDAEIGDRPSLRQLARDQLHPREVPPRYWAGILGVGLLAFFPVFAVLGLLPFSLTILDVSNFIPVLYLMMFAMSWDFVSGYTGQFSFGHTFFFTIGGYGSALLALQHGFSPLVSIPIAVLLATLGGLLIGVPTLRLRGPYFTLITLIAPLVLLQLFIYFDGVFKGRDGLTQSPPNIIGTRADSVITVTDFKLMILWDYYLAFLVMLLVLVVLMVITRSKTGEIFTAIRENEDVVQATGKNAGKFKIFAFTFSGAVGGLAGALFVHSTAGHPLPELLLYVGVSIEVILVVLIGGAGTIVGAIVGTLLFELVKGGATMVSQGPNPWVIPILSKTPEQLMPVPLFIIAMIITYHMPEGVTRRMIIEGRRLQHRYSLREYPTIGDLRTRLTNRLDKEK